MVKPWEKGRLDELCGEVFVAFAERAVKLGQPPTVVRALDHLVEMDQVFTEGELEVEFLVVPCLQEDSFGLIEPCNNLHQDPHGLIARMLLLRELSKHPIGYFFEFTPFGGKHFGHFVEIPPQHDLVALGVVQQLDVDVAHRIDLVQREGQRQNPGEVVDQVVQDCLVF